MMLRIRFSPSKKETQGVWNFGYGLKSSHPYSLFWCQGYHQGIDQKGPFFLADNTPRMVRMGLGTFFICLKLFPKGNTWSRSSARGSRRTRNRSHNLQQTPILGKRTGQTIYIFRLSVCFSSTFFLLFFTLSNPIQMLISQTINS